MNETKTKTCKVGGGCYYPSLFREFPSFVFDKSLKKKGEKRIKKNSTHT